MRHGLLFASPLVAALAAAVAFLPGTACSSDDSDSVDGDAGDGSVDDDATLSGDDDAGDAAYPNADATVIACTLHTSANDPVSLCVQKTILQTWKRNARISSGIASGWSATTGIVTMDAGAPIHDFHDDLGYGSAIADYHASSNCYGDNQITGILDDDLIALEPTIVADVTPLPAEYRGDTYFRLRRIAAGLRYVNETTEADAIDGLAETYGRALASSYFVDLGPIATTLADAGAPSAADAGDAGDAAAVANAADAAASTVDAGGAAGAFDDGVVGTPTGGAATYKTADTAMAALALLDLASRHTADNSAAASVLEAAAAGTFYHLYARARDASGFYFTQLSTTPATPAHDTPSDTSGTFSADVQAQVAFAFLDAARIAAANPALTFTPTLPLVAQGESLVAAVNGATSLYDATNGGYLSAITLPSTLATTKTVLSNAFFLETARDDVANGSGSVVFLGQLAPLKALLVATSPGTGFLGMFTGQNAYVPVANADFSPVGGAGLDPTYSSAATAVALTALNHELPSNCAE